MCRLKLVLTLTCALALSTLPLVAAETPVLQTAAPQTAQHFAQTRDRLLTKAQSTALNGDDHFSLATSLLGLGQFGEALVVARLGLGLTQDPVEKGVFYMVIAQCHGARGDYDDAAAAALEGQRVDPLSKDLAALRFAYFTKHGDQAQTKAAEDTLKQLDPSGRPVLNSEQFWGLVIGVTQAVLACKALYETAGQAWERMKPHVEDVKKSLDTLWSNAKSASTRAAGNVRAR